MAGCQWPTAVSRVKQNVSGLTRKFRVLFIFLFAVTLLGPMPLCTSGELVSSTSLKSITPWLMASALKRGVVVFGFVTFAIIVTCGSYGRASLRLAFASTIGVVLRAEPAL